MMWNDGSFEHLLSDPYAEHPVVNRHIMNGGGKGGGAQQPTSTTSTVNQSNLPEYARPYYESILNRSQQVSNDPYVPYGGERIAPFNQTQAQAFGLAESNVGQWRPQVNAAGNSINQADFNPQQVTNTFQAGQWTDPGVAQSYMSPYMQNVVDIGKREATRDFNVQQTGRDTAATQAGAFGGYRHGIVDAEAGRNLNQQLQDIQATGQQQAYQTGLGAFNQDRNALAQESQLGMQAAGANNQYGLQAGQLDLSRGQAQAGLGQLMQQMGQSDVSNLLNIGNMQNAQTQAGMDMAYQDFLNQRDYDRQNLNWMSGILRGVPVSANSNVTGYQYQAPPNQMSQVAGLGLGAAGLAKMFS